MTIDGHVVRFIDFTVSNFARTERTNERINLEGPGKHIQISPRSVSDFDWADKLMNLGIDRRKVKDSPLMMHR